MAEEAIEVGGVEGKILLQLPPHPLLLAAINKKAERLEKSNLSAFLL
ncbi:hypothetical protein [Botryobacter ruber]|nr:hypothetical protein [Botryobacter ruber]